MQQRKNSLRDTFRTLIQLVAGTAALLALQQIALANKPVSLVETPSLQAAVKDGTLPPVEQRLPLDPRVIDLAGDGRQPGLHGGTLRLLMGKEKDIRMMTVYGYARLVGYDTELQIQPDILQSIDVQDSKIFTLKLRPGHRWSDGSPFTAEAFRYWWEDVALNEDLSPYGPPKVMRQGERIPEFEVIDEHTVQYRWQQPNPYFLPALAGAKALYIYAPGHYLKQFHKNYVKAEALEKMIADLGKRNWMGVYLKNSKLDRQTNPALPTLQPWVNTTKPPSERFLFKRNPYYHRIDENGKQLPYLDQVIINVVSASLVAAKSGAGESDLQARQIRLDDYTFLKAGEKNHDYQVRLWRQALGSQIALYPNLNANDPVWRDLVRDKRFRHALSLAVNRHEINQVVYFGLVAESNNLTMPQCSLNDPSYQEAYTAFDLKRANALLDEMGLTERNADGLRLMPDGRPLEIIVQSAGESTEETDVLELIHDSWLQVGIKLYTRPSQREVFRDRVFSGEAMMSVWAGIPNGIPTADMSPEDFVPSRQDQYQWPTWGQYAETNGKVGRAPDIDSAKELLTLRDKWESATDPLDRKKYWREILDIHAEEIYSIGTVCGVPQPVVVHKQLKNVPDEGLYNYNPGAFFGIYQPDTFWFDGERRVKN